MTQTHNYAQNQNVPSKSFSAMLMFESFLIHNQNGASLMDAPFAI